MAPSRSSRIILRILKYINKNPKIFKQIQRNEALKSLNEGLVTCLDIKAAPVNTSWSPRPDND
jgi:hypothetical protein